MKKIGLIGGMSWESSAEYYRIINEEVKRRLGGLSSAEVIMYSVNFAEIEAMQAADDWEGAANRMVQAAQAVERAGADFTVLATNTMHITAPAIKANTDIPLLHIAHPTGEAVRAAGITKIGLLGTRYTMEKDFYIGELQEEYDLEVVTPSTDDRKKVNDIIYHELCLGKVLPESQQEYLRIIRTLGAQGVILGCTEIGLLVQQKDTDIPLFDTTSLHAMGAVDKALAT